MKEFMQSLSKEQFDAIVASGSVLLTAIPGSGKTRSLINKIIYEYDKDDGAYIIAITYTRRAASEIEDRIQENLGTMPSNIWIGTIHKFCLEFIVRGYGSYSSLFSKNFHIIGELDQEKIRTELRKKYNVPSPYIAIDYTLNVNGQPNEMVFRELVIEYNKKLIELNKIDFDNILYEAYSLLKKHPHIRQQLSKIIKLICIDEYQDTQELQYQILGLISNSNYGIKLFITGDSNQAIYEGIGGVIKSLKELNVIFGRKFKKRNLTGCYRSNQKIIDFYKKFAVSKMEMKSKTEIWRHPQISIIYDETKSQVFDRILDIIKQSLVEGYKESDIAVVAPQWYHLYEITAEIKKRFPNIKLDAPDIVPLKRDDDSIIFKLSKLLLTYFDYHNLFRIKQLASDIIKQFYVEYGINIDKSAVDFLNLIRKSQTAESIGTEFLKKSLISIFTRLDLINTFEKEIISFVDETKARVEKFKTQGVEDEKIYFEQSLRSKSGIVISSCHGIKGEEYAIVIAFALLEGYIPHWNDKINHEELARQRSKKLLFVIFSRAKEKLYIFAENDRLTHTGRLMLVNEDLKLAKEKISNQ